MAPTTNLREQHVLNDPSRQPAFFRLLAPKPKGLFFLPDVAPPYFLPSLDRARPLWVWRWSVPRSPSPGRKVVCCCTLLLLLLLLLSAEHPVVCPIFVANSVSSPSATIVSPIAFAAAAAAAAVLPIFYAAVAVLSAILPLLFPLPAAADSPAALVRPIASFLPLCHPQKGPSSSSSFVHAPALVASVEFMGYGMRVSQPQSRSTSDSRPCTRWEGAAGGQRCVIDCS